jgi:hypothetical protein
MFSIREKAIEVEDAVHTSNLLLQIPARINRIWPAFQKEI